MAQDAFSAAGLLGSVIDGRFEILEKLGEGGMGAIYKARQLSVDRVVALKILLHDQRGDPISVERFRHEAYLASRLKHPNAIVIHDFGQSEQGLLYIAMEFLAGETLKQRLRRVGPLPVDAAVKVMSQTLRTIAEAHRMGLVHRDLKPDNVFLTRVEGNEDFVKVLDFGIAKLTAVQEGSEIDGYQGGLTVAGKIYGTPNYMSPEQIRAKTVDQQSDLYSLGVIFYEVLAGRLPFLGETPVDVMMMHLRDAVPPLRSLRPDVPPELERTVLRAMEKDRRARYQSGDEFLEALENYKFNSGFYAAGGHLGPLPTRPVVSAAPAPSSNGGDDDDEDEGQGETLLLGDTSGSSASGVAPAVSTPARREPGRALRAMSTPADEDEPDSTAIAVNAASVFGGPPPVEERTMLELPDEGGAFDEKTFYESEDDGAGDDSPFTSVGGDSLDGGLGRPPPRPVREEMTMLELDDEELEEVEPSRIVAIPTADAPNAVPAARRTAFQQSLRAGDEAPPPPSKRPAPVPAPAPAGATPEVRRTAQGMPRMDPPQRPAPLPRSLSADASTGPPPRAGGPSAPPRTPGAPPTPAPSRTLGATPTPAPSAARSLASERTPVPAPGPLQARPTPPTTQRPTQAINLPARDGSKRALVLGLTFFVLVGVGAAAVVLLDPFGQGGSKAAPAGPPVVHIDSDPAGVEIFDRGLFVGESPNEYNVTPTGQPHTFQIATADRRTFRVTFDERPGARWLYVKVPPAGDGKLGVATLRSEPGGATVKVGGKAIGRTPLTYLGAPGAPVEVELEVDGKVVAKRQETPTAEGVDVQIPLGAP